MLTTTGIATLTTRILRGALHSGALLLLLIGIPVGLVVAVGWPLPDQVPDPAAIWLALKQQNIPGEVVVNSLAVMVWLLWAQLAWAILWDVGVNARRVASGLDLQPAPFVVAGIDSLATRLVSGTMAVSVFVASSTVASALPSAATATTAQEYVEVTPAGDIVATKAVSAPMVSVRPVWKVVKGDSAWSIAETVLGDGSRFGELAALNTHVLTARDVVPGIRLILPAGSVVPEDRNPRAAVGTSGSGMTRGVDEAKTAGAAFEEAEQPAPESVTVVKGDHLWGLATTHLESTTTGTPTDQDVSAYVQRVVALNPDVVEDPDLIFPGEVFQLPANNADPSEKPEPVDPGETASGFLPVAEITIERFDHLWGLSETRLTEANGWTPTLEILTYVNAVIDLNADIVEDPDLIFPGEMFTFPAIGTPPVQAAAPEPTQDPPPNTEQPVIPPVSSTSLSPTSGSDPIEVSSGERGEGVSATSYLLGLVGAVVTATGLLAAYRALKKRRDALGVDVEGSKVGQVERAMIAASDLPLLRWAGQELSLLVENLNPDEVSGGPVLVEISETGLELLWDKPQPVAPHPWEATDGGTAWRLLFDPDAPIPADELPAGIPGLVTLGTRPDGGTVLVDLEALGSLSVTGDQAVVENTIRAITLEIGASEELANIGVCVVGIDVDGGEHLPRIRTRSADEAFAHLKGVIEDFQGMITTTGVRDSFGLRAKTGVGPDCSVVVANAANCANLAELVEASEPRRGAAVVVAGDVPSTRARLIVEADGTAVLEPLGLRLQVAAMSRETASEIAVLMDKAATADNLNDPSPVTNEEVQQLILDEQNTATGTPITRDPSSKEPTTSKPKPSVSETAENDATVDSSDERSVPTASVLAKDEADSDEQHHRTDASEDARSAGSAVVSESNDDAQVLVDPDGTLDLERTGIDLTKDEAGWEQPTSDLIITVLGAPQAPGFDELVPRQIGLLAYLASNGGSATSEQLLDHLYADHSNARSKKTLWNLITSTRRVVGPGILPATDKSEMVRTTAITDLQVFESLIARAEVVSRNQSIRLLSEAVRLIDGPPFDHPQFEWARSVEFYEPARKVIEDTVLRLVKLALETDNAGIAREAVDQGLRALGVNERLYRARMRIGAQDGDRAEVNRTFLELKRKLAVHFDDSSPSVQTCLLRDRLAGGDIRTAR